jgi:hypothetical protein
MIYSSCCPRLGLVSLFENALMTMSLLSVSQLAGFTFISIFLQLHFVFHPQPAEMSLRTPLDGETYF